MADPKGTDPKADTKPKTGPVKPPVLDLTARETTKPVPPKTEPIKPEPAKADAIKPEPSKSDTPKPDLSKAEPTKSESAKFEPSKPATPVPPVPPILPRAAAKPNATGPAIAAAIAGGVLGLAAAYGLASAGWWPSTPAAPTAEDPRIATFATAIPELETVTQTTQSELATLNQRIGALEGAAPGAAMSAPTDLSGIETELAALRTELDALAATPAQVTDTSALQTDLTALNAKFDEIAARLGTAEAELRTLDTTVTATSDTLASQPSDIGAVLQLPLILSGFEQAFATGRPYETELGALRAAAPEASIPTPIANGASTGLTRPDVIARRFAEVLPAMLAGKPANPDAGWQQGALDWLGSAVALQPTGEIEGDTPDAVMSRLDGAIARRDFAAAETLLTALPAPMVTAAEDLPKLIADQAEAARFLETLRSQALSGEVTP